MLFWWAYHSAWAHELYCRPTSHARLQKNGEMVIIKCKKCSDQSPRQLASEKFHNSDRPQNLTTLRESKRVKISEQIFEEKI